MVNKILATIGTVAMLITIIAKWPYWVTLLLGVIVVVLVLTTPNKAEQNTN